MRARKQARGPQQKLQGSLQFVHGGAAKGVFTADLVVAAPGVAVSDGRF